MLAHFFDGQGTLLFQENLPDDHGWPKVLTREYWGTPQRAGFREPMTLPDPPPRYRGDFLLSYVTDGIGIYVLAKFL